MWTEETPWVWQGPAPTEVAAAIPTNETVQMTWAGDKFAGSFGPTQLFSMDYWTLRERSAQLFRENMYARGIIRRLITNEIATGLKLESCPEESILGYAEDALSEWTETVETRNAIWGDNPQLCDYEGRRTDAELQAEARQEAIIDGDILVILHQDPVTKCPQVQLVNGGLVQTPIDAAGATVVDGVELDSRKRHVAYWVTQDDGTSKRIPAYGPRTGRRIAWLAYGLDKRADDVRGEPALAIVLQSLKEVDRYRDSVQRKATTNSMIAAIVTKGQNKPGTLPITGGATRKSEATVSHSTETGRKFGITEHIPGMVIEELQQDEDLKQLNSSGTDEKFGEFEAAVIHAIAWCLEIPPEIALLAFSNNYSASQAAINEFRIYLNRSRTRWAGYYNKPIYVEWFISEVLTGRIGAPGFLNAWRDKGQFDVYGAWIASDWSGAIKPSTDIVKQAKGYKLLEQESWVTNARSARELTGTKFSKNVRQRRRENEQKVEAMRPLVEFEREYKDSEVAQVLLREVI